MKKNVLILAAHPDDETLGCGASIAKLSSQNHDIKLLTFTDGESSKEKTLNNNRKNCLEKVSKILGIKSFKSGNFPDNRMDSTPLLDIIQKLEPIIEKLKPSIIYTHHHGDLNIDHQLTHTAVMTACRPLPNSSVREIYGFEILSSTEWSVSQHSLFNPTFFVDITEQFSILAFLIARK